MLKKIILVIAIMLIPFMLSYAQNVPLKDYKAEAQNEKEIVDVLQALSDGWKTKDKEQILSYCNENAQFSDLSGSYISKEKMLGQEVSDWGPKSKKWYGYYDVNMKIDGDKAEVTCNEMRSYGFHKATMQLIKEDQKWQILQYDWQP